MVSGIGTWAGLITAVCTALMALIGLVVMVVSRRTKKTVDKTHQQTIVIHQLFTDLERWNKALRNALENAGIAIPEDQSKVLLDEPGSTP